MHIPYISAVGTLSSLGSVLNFTRATDTESVVRVPLQTGNTLIANGTTLGVHETDLAVPFGVTAAAIPFGNEVHFTAAPAQETTTPCNPFEPNCGRPAGGCSLGCVPDFNGGCQYWGPSCYQRPTTAPDVPLPTAPATTTQGTIVQPPTTTFIMTITSTTSNFNYITVTSHVTRADDPKQSSATIDTASGEPGASSSYALDDELYGLLKQSVREAALSTQQRYIDDHLWESLYQLGKQNGVMDVNKDGNTVDGLAWDVRKKLGWPPKISDPANPKPSDATIAVQKLVHPDELDEMILQAALDANGEKGTETTVVEQPPEQHVNSGQFSLADIFTTDLKTYSLSWQDFEAQQTWNINSGYRPYVLLRHTEIVPAVEPRAGWDKTVQVLINKHVPFEQAGQLPSDMERNLFLELDEAFKGFLQEVKHNGAIYVLPNRYQATDDDIIDELKYKLLYEYAKSPILVAATAEEVQSLGWELLNDGHFIQSIGGQQVLVSLFRSPDFYEGVKTHIRAAKIMGRSLHDLAITLEGPIYDAISKAYYSSPDNRGTGNGGNNMLKPLGVDMGAADDQDGSLDEAVDGGRHGMFIHDKPLLSLKNLLCPAKCSFMEESCTC